MRPDEGLYGIIRRADHFWSEYQPVPFRVCTGEEADRTDSPLVSKTANPILGQIWISAKACDGNGLI